jgi:CHAD domain-containing protein
VLGGASEAGNADALATLRSERYVVLLERLVDAAWEPMTAPEAEEPARTAVPALITATWHRLRKRVRRLDSDRATDHDWHKVRIAAKQLRYSCDAVEPVVGKPARRLSKQAERIQDTLGEHQDAVVSAAFLREQATSRGSGTVAFTLGVLHARQTDAARVARAEFRRVWAKASRSRHRRWLAP